MPKDELNRAERSADIREPNLQELLTMSFYCFLDLRISIDSRSLIGAGCGPKLERLEEGSCPIMRRDMKREYQVILTLDTGWVRVAASYCLGWKGSRQFAVIMPSM